MLKPTRNKRRIAALTGALALSACLALGLAGCAGNEGDGTSEAATPATEQEANADAEAAAEAESGTITFTDDLGRTVSLDAPRRVAALIGSFADIWCLAGGHDTLVAAADDAWTSFDLGLGGDVANLGAIKEPALETLLAAEPDLVLASCNTAADVELLEVFESAGVTAAYFDVQGFGDYLRMLEICTSLTGCEEN